MIRGRHGSVGSRRLASVVKKEVFKPKVSASGPRTVNWDSGLFATSVTFVESRPSPLLSRLGRVACYPEIGHPRQATAVSFCGGRGSNAERNGMAVHAIRRPFPLRTENVRRDRLISCSTTSVCGRWYSRWR